MPAIGTLRIPELAAPAGRTPVAGDAGTLARFIATHRRLLVITGAGCSTASGIPAYRDGEGRWSRRSPILYPDFIGQAVMRRRYWARSYFGWPRMKRARPNAGHHALARLEHRGRLSGLITQNVDGLHRRAGHRNLIELHGALGAVICLACHRRIRRDDFQARLSGLNPDWHPDVLGFNPDGDAELDAESYPGFRIAECEACGGILKPEVVFFGESVPKTRTAQVARAVAACDAVLVVGTSLVVASAYRIVRDAAAAGLPVAAINDGRTRADDLLAFKVPGECHDMLAAAIAAATT